ncbi:hypothetical protein DL771_011977 [Monosporascus sp. 5C6A]|nr:hypothetical protein DL771_011977 [Monosporascus sp. 5C6A]
MASRPRKLYQRSAPFRLLSGNDDNIGGYNENDDHIYDNGYGRPGTLPAACSPLPTVSNTTESGKNIAVCFTNWGIYGAKYRPNDLPASRIAHVLYAFADIAPDGEVMSSDSWADIEKRYEGDLWSDSGKNA